jgi:hypothetical protein
MELVFTENRGGHGNYNYTMKIENDICTWSCDRSEVQQWMHFNNPPYNVPSYIPKSIKELIEISANTSQRFTMWNFANNLKNVLTVTLKDELDDIILHYVKELKETENKLKETENKLKELNDKLKESINNTQFYESLLTKQNDKLKELYDKQKNMIIVGEEC